MIFCHIVDDYYLQGILASMKQKAWWEKQEGYSNKYAGDYMMALIAHAVSWSFMVHLILFFFNIPGMAIYISIILNAIFHAYIDNEKANKKSINLVTDQSCHFLQIAVTWMIFIIFLIK
jgi:phosphate/sulfate permease